MSWKFETYVEKIKFDVLREVARASYAGNFKDVEAKLPEILVPGRKANYRCCVYMERAIMAERIKITRGGEWDDFNIIDVIPIACDQCPMGGYTVTESCRGCIGHACKQACPKGAITVDSQHRAHIDKEKCVNCGLCAKACPFGAIYNFRRPCQKACPTGAITMDGNLSAKIDYSKCIVCGSCTQKCPFGAIASKTFITFVIDHIRNNILATKKRPIFAIVAPSVAAQFPGVKVEQIIEGIKKLGFTDIVEAAMGADIVTENEAKELVVKKVLTSSCCPAFVSYIQKFHPELRDKISHNPSPMAQTGKLIKAKYPDALTIFIGPCTAKKDERSKPEVRPYVDYVLTFTELRAMLSARDIELEKLKGEPLEGGSSFGRNFARIGGLSEAVVQALKELDIKDFELSSLACSGMKECIKAIESLATGTSKYNFIEGMACEGGCICGPESINHNTAVGKAFVNAYARSAKTKTIKESIEASGGRNYDVEYKKAEEAKAETKKVEAASVAPIPDQPGLKGKAFQAAPKAKHEEHTVLKQKSIFSSLRRLNSSDVAKDSKKVDVQEPATPAKPVEKPATPTKPVEQEPIEKVTAAAAKQEAKPAEKAVESVSEKPAAKQEAPAKPVEATANVEPPKSALASSLKTVQSTEAKAQPKPAQPTKAPEPKPIEPVKPAPAKPVNKPSAGPARDAFTPDSQKTIKTTIAKPTKPVFKPATESTRSKKITLGKTLLTKPQENSTTIVVDKQITIAESSPKKDDDSQDE